MSSNDIQLYSTDAEMGVLGSMLLSEKACGDVIPLLRPESFAHSTHQRIYEVFSLMHSARVTIDIVTAANHLRDRVLLDKIGGPEYLLQLAEFVPSPANAIDYAHIVRDYAVRRQLLDIAKKVGKHVISTQEDKLLSESFRGDVSAYLQKMQDLLATSTQGSISPMGLNYAALPQGPRTGLTVLDKHCNSGAGLRYGEYTLLVAKRGTGKSLIGQQTCIHAAKLGLPTLFVSLEMNQASLSDRARMIYTGHASLPDPDDMFSDANDDWTNKIATLNALPARVYAPSNPNLHVIVGEIEQLVLTQKYQVVVIDYVGLLQCNARDELTKMQTIATAFTGLARRLDATALLLLSQATDKGTGISARYGAELENGASAIVTVAVDDVRHEATETPHGQGVTYLQCTITKDRHGSGLNKTTLCEISNRGGLMVRDSPIDDDTKSAIKAYLGRKAR